MCITYEKTQNHSHSIPLSSIHFALSFRFQFQIFKMKITNPFRLTMKSSMISSLSGSGSPSESPLSPLRSSDLGQDESPHQARSQATKRMSPNFPSPTQPQLLPVESDISCSGEASDLPRAPSNLMSNVSSMMKSIFKTFKQHSRSHIAQNSENAQVSVTAETSSIPFAASSVIPASPL